MGSLGCKCANKVNSYSMEEHMAFAEINNYSAMVQWKCCGKTKQYTNTESGLYAMMNEIPDPFRKIILRAWGY